MVYAFIVGIVFGVVGIAGEDGVAKSGLSAETSFSLPALTAATVESSRPVQFADSHLKRLVEEALGKTDPNAVDMSRLKILKIPHEPVTSLSGLEFAVNLEGLNISFTGIRCFQALRNLNNLKWIYVNGCDVRDGSTLGRIKSLTLLAAEKCGLEDISFVADLGNLIGLFMSENAISDLSPLRSLPNLQGIRMHNNRISDISQLRGLTQISNIFMGQNLIEDISVLSCLKQLESVSLYGNKIKDISSLTTLDNLLSVCLQRNPLSENSLRQIPSIYKNMDQEFPLRHVIHENHKVLSPNTSGADSAQDLVISFQHGVLRQDERSIAIVVGQRSTWKLGPDEPWHETFLYCQAYVLELGTGNVAVQSVPESHGIREMAWRPGADANVPELLLFKTGIFYGEPDCIKVFSMQKGKVPYEAFSSSLVRGESFSVSPSLVWSPDGQILLGRGNIHAKKTTAMMDYESREISFPDIPWMVQYCHLSLNRMCATDGKQLYYVTISDAGEISCELSRKEDPYAAHDSYVLLAGPVDGQAVYTMDSRSIYLGDKIVYDVDSDIISLFASGDYIAFQHDKGIKVLDCKGNSVYEKVTDRRYRILALAGKRKILYLLHKQQAIEAFDLQDKGRSTVICSVNEIID